MLSLSNVYKSCCCMSILISLCPNVILNMDCTCETRSWQCDHQKLVRLQYSRYQPSQIFHTTKPNDCKNVRRNKFLSTGRSNNFDRCHLSSKNYVPCFDFKTSISRYCYRISFASVHVQSNDDFFFAKIEQLSVLIQHESSFVICYHSLFGEWYATRIRR